MLRFHSSVLAMLLVAVSAAGQSFDPVVCYGGRSEFMRFVKQELVYPPKAMEERKQGTVYVYCIVNANGSTRDARIFKGVSPEVDAEAMRLFNKVLWEPAIQDGQNHDSEAILEIPFDISRYKRWCKKRGYTELQYPYGPPKSTNHVYSRHELDSLPQPLLPDSSMTLKQHIAKNIRYPQAAVRQSIEGVARVSFVVEPNGTVSNVYAANYLGGGCTEEVMTVLRNVRWYPGVQNGETVRTLLNVSFTFRLPEEQPARSAATVPHSMGQ